MKTSILTTAAAALIAGVTGLTLATTTSAGVPKNLNLSGACTQIHGGWVDTSDTGNASGWSTGICVRHTIITHKSNLPFRAFGYANFKKFVGLKATKANLKKCANSVVILHFYQHMYAPNKWRRVQKVKVNAVPKINYLFKISSCKAAAGTKYVFGAWMYRTVVMAIDGEGKNKGNTIVSLIRSKKGYF